MSDHPVELIDRANDDITSLDEGLILDYITGEPVKDSPKEQVLQRIARALFHEYGISVEDMIPGFKMKVDGRLKKIDIATSIMVASQDPPSVPIALIELSSQIILHRFNSPAWLKHLQKANAALGGLTPEKMARLGPGEAYLWSSKATDDAFRLGAIKMKCRPRVTRHGGETKTAVKD